jgi:hypothetical protein
MRLQSRLYIIQNVNHVHPALCYSIIMSHNYLKPLFSVLNDLLFLKSNGMIILYDHHISEVNLLEFLNSLFSVRS